jgi:hypothetical protein
VPCLDVCEQLLAQAKEPSRAEEGAPWSLVKLFDIFFVVFVENVSFEVAHCSAGSLADAACPTIIFEDYHSLTSHTAAISLVLSTKRL